MLTRSTPLLLASLAAAAAGVRADIVINEVHYDAEPKTEYVEFIELLNTGPGPVDLSGWSFSAGITRVFPSGTTLNAGAYLLVAENPGALTAKYPGVTAQVLEYSGSLSNDGEKLELRDSLGVVIDSVDYRAEFPWPVSPNGEGASMQLLNPSLDNDLGGAWRGAAPTPGAANAVLTGNAPPIIRQVDHSPQVPTAATPTTVTAKVSDPDGVATVNLLYQVVAPGAYIPAYLPHNYSTLTGSPNSPLQANPEFENPANWTTIAMTDDGSGADLVAADGIYTAQIPAQTHRTLVRYRISATDAQSATIRVPYADDASLNFAFFVYNGVPDWTASNSVYPGEPTHTYSSAALSTLPVYTMITRNQDRAYAYAYSSTGDSGLQIPKANVAASQAFNWECAFVYDGVVYDHVKWRLRQRNDRYSGDGKRSMRFRFNRGHHFQARDEDGNLLAVKWRSLNTGKMSRFDGVNNYGLPETMNSKLWRMVGVECPLFFPVHFRMIDGADESPDQYNGDFFGLATVVQDIDGNLLDDRGLPNGNMYKLKDGVTDPLELQRNQARQSVSDGSDFQNVRNNLNSSQTDTWLSQHVDWDQWSRYHAVVEAVRHYDFGTTSSHLKNRAWYFQPATDAPYGLLRIIPHDHDATWLKGYHDSFNSQGIAVGTGYPWAAIFDDIRRPPSGTEKSAFTRGYRNFLREFRDLLWQEETVNNMINQHVALLAEFSMADRDRWTGGPAAAGTETMQSLEEIAEPMRNVAFVSDTMFGANLVGGRGAYLDQLATDNLIPDTPSISYDGTPGFPTDSLVFTSSDFSSTAGGAGFGKMEWRIAEVAGLTINVAQQLISSGDPWKFLDDGTDPGATWKLTGYDDSTWGEGATQIGYGESDEATVISSGHPAILFRKTVNITDISTIESFEADIIRDDGAVVYVNGVEVWRNQMPEGEITHQTLASTTASGSNESSFHAFTIPADKFVTGVNTIAVSVHQYAANSGDMSFDFKLRTVPALVPASVERIYEWNNPWESGELPTFQATLTPPAVATRAGRSYRARVRHQDDTGRWSHWSAPLEFTASTSNLEIFKASLVISEVMYHPASPTAAELAAGYDDDDYFEYIEIRNIGTQVIDLANVRLTKGVDFDFAGSSVTSLAPGGYVLVVNNLAAFTMRYGAGLPVAGAWSGKLDNGGERLKLSYGAGEAIIDFDYDDEAGWPLSADGDGFSLVLIDPLGTPNPAEPLNWRASTAVHGTPGGTDGSIFAGGNADDFLAYATREHNTLVHPDGHVDFSIEFNQLAEDVDGELQVSTDLVHWQAADSLMQKTSVQTTSGPYARVTFSTLSPPAAPRWFLRYQVKQR
ncbi:MAG: lamin tail domain-containing protein [Akkermansiaceae bacterium]|nr:lamin tail domain-containing protein [Akkermansiaceae bacterium]